MSWQPGIPPQSHQQPGMTPPPPPPRRWRFRWGLWVVVPLVCLAAACLVNSIELNVCEWREVMRWLSVRQPDRYSRLVALAIILLAVVAILRVIRDGKKDE